MKTTNSNIGELVRELETNYISGSVQVSRYVSENFYEDISTIEAYLNSKHTTGEKDTLERDKPFFNIVLAARNIWYRATDIDRKNIRAKANKAKDFLTSFLFTIHLQKWMKDENFGQFLNDWGLYLASYNSAVCKFVEQKGRMRAVVVPWDKMIMDVIDFKNNPKIEILEFTPAQLRKKEIYDQEMVEELISAATSRKTVDGQQKDIKADYIKLYEIHGELPLSYLTGKQKDEKTYVQQIQVLSFTAGKNGQYDDFVLFKGREKKDPYLLTSLIPNTDGSISLMGSVKTLFEAQWMVNHSIKAIKDYLDLASKLIYQTADTNFFHQNALSAIETGDILIHKDNMPITQVQNSTNDITALQNFGAQWRLLAQELTSTPDIMQGTNMPSGTAYRQAAIIQQEAHSNYEIMIENKGLAIEQMFREYITPYLLKKMDTTEEVSATLDAYGIDKIDQMYVATKAIERFNSKAVEAVLNDTELPDLGQEQMKVKQELNQMGNQRFIKPSDISNKTWKEVIGDFEGEIEYEITNENIDKQTLYDTLTSVLQTIATNPMVLQDPNGKLIFNKILEETGKISPVELQNTMSIPTAPVMGGQGSAVEQMQITQ